MIVYFFGDKYPHEGSENVPSFQQAIPGITLEGPFAVPWILATQSRNVWPRIPLPTAEHRGKNLKGILLSESQGQNLAMTILYVPLSWLDGDGTSLHARSLLTLKRAPPNVDTGLRG
jgi:hypothetical protein